MTTVSTQNTPTGTTTDVDDEIEADEATSESDRRAKLDAVQVRGASVAPAIGARCGRTAPSATRATSPSTSGSA